jgi:hypothetical protein
VVAKPMMISQRYRGTPFSVKRCSPAPSPKTSYFSGHYKYLDCFQAPGSNIEMLLQKCLTASPGSEKQKLCKASYHYQLLDGKTSTKVALNGPNEFCNRL